MWIALVLFAVIVPLVVVALKIDDWGRDLSTNRAATNPDADHPLMRSLAQRFTLEELDAVLAAICQSQPQWSQPATAKPLPDDSPFKHLTDIQAVRHLVHASKLFRLRDDVWIVVHPAGDEEHEEGKLRMHVESRSRVGIGDLGQNPRNLRELNELLVERLILKTAPGSR